MKSLFLSFSGTPLNGAPSNGLADSRYWAKYRAFGGCYGFSLRPWMAASDLVAGGAGVGYKWTSSLGVPLPPGLFPVLAKVDFEGGASDLVLVPDASFRHFGGRRIENVDLFVPVLPLTPYVSSLTGTLTAMGYAVDLTTEKSEAIFPSSRPQLRRFPLFYADQWADTTNGRPYLVLTANADWSGKLIDPMNFWGLTDDVTPGTGATVGGFYVWPSTKRWRVVLRSTGGGAAAADVSIWTRADQGDFLTAGLTLNEVVAAGDWTKDVDGTPALVLERDAGYMGEWIFLSAAGAAGPGAWNASNVYVAGGDMVVEL